MHRILRVLKAAWLEIRTGEHQSCEYAQQVRDAEAQMWSLFARLNETQVENANLLYRTRNENREVNERCSRLARHNAEIIQAFRTKVSRTQRIMYQTVVEKNNELLSREIIALRKELDRQLEKRAIVEH